jgi:hypothetical protein
MTDWQTYRNMNLREIWIWNDWRQTGSQNLAIASTDHAVGKVVITLASSC